MIKRIGGLFLHVLTFFMIVPLQLNVFNHTLKISLYVNSIMALIGFSNLIRRAAIKRVEFNIVFYLLFIFLYFIVNSIFHGFFYLPIVRMMLFAIVLYIAFMTLGRLYKRRYGDKFGFELLKSVVFVGLIHSFVGFISIFLPEYVYGVVGIGDVARDLVDKRIRTPGLFYDGFAIVSVFYALLFCIAVIVYSVENVFKTIFISIVFLMYIFVTARSGFVIVFVGVFAMIIYSLIFSRLVAKHIFKKILLVLCLMLVPLIFLFEMDSSLKNNLSWALEPVMVYLKTGELTTESTAILFGEMYFFPKDELSLLFGTGNFSMTDIGSDSGYVAFIHGGGLFGLLLFFSIYFYFYFIFYKSSIDFRIRFLGFLVILSVFVGNIKDGYYFSYTGGWLCVLFVLLSIVALDDRESIYAK